MFKYALLCLLAQHPRHGYELKVVFDKIMSSLWPPINIGQIYTTLARLERDGLVKDRQVVQNSRPDKRVYELTENGQEALSAWFEQTIDVTQIKNELIVKLVFAQVTGFADVRALLARQRRQYLQALRALDELTPQPGTGDAGDDGNAVGNHVMGLLIAGAALHLQADLKWIELCEEHLPQLNSLEADEATATGKRIRQSREQEKPQ